MSDQADFVSGMVHHANARFAHLWAILRHDAFHAAGTAPQVTITVTKVFADPAHATREVERLNFMARQRGLAAHYWVQVTRFVPASYDDRPGDPTPDWTESS